MKLRMRIHWDGFWLINNYMCGMVRTTTPLQAWKLFWRSIGDEAKRQYLKDLCPQLQMSTCPECGREVAMLYEIDGARGMCKECAKM